MTVGGGGTGQETRQDRRVLLDGAALLRARASQVLALDPAAIGSVVVLEADAPLAPSPDGSAVAVMAVRGPLSQRAYDGSLCGYVDGYDAIAGRFAAALDDPKVGALVLAIDSPGGDVAGLEEGIRRMVEARDMSGKPVFAYADEVAASAAYWIASSVAGRGRVFLPPSGQVGSIGCIGARVDETAALAKEGLAVTLVRDPQGKAASHPAGPIAEIADERLTSIVKSASSRFVKAIAAGRKMSQRDVRGLDGAMLQGEAAVEGGLADGTASLEQVIVMAAEAARRTMAMREQMIELRGQLGLSNEATEDEILEAVSLALGHATAEIELLSAGASLAELGAAVCGMAGAEDPAAARGTVEAWRASHERAQDERRNLDAERKALEIAERDKLVTRLVTSGWETPPTAWADPRVATDPSMRQPAEPWASMPIAALRARVATLVAQPRAIGGEAPAPVTGAGLSEIERRICKSRGLAEDDYIAQRDALRARRTRDDGIAAG